MANPSRPNSQTQKDGEQVKVWRHEYLIQEGVRLEFVSAVSRESVLSCVSRVFRRGSPGFVFPLLPDSGLYRICGYKFWP